MVGGRESLLRSGSWDPPPWHSCLLSPQVGGIILRPHPHSFLLPRSDTTKIFPHFLWKTPGRSVYGCSGEGAHLCTVWLGHLETQELECVGIWSPGYLSLPPKSFPISSGLSYQLGPVSINSPSPSSSVYVYTHRLLSLTPGFSRVSGTRGHP